MRVRRSRRLAAPPADVWAVVSDPYTLPRWWPRTERVEDVRPDGWTSVLTSQRGRGVRADWTVTEQADGRRRAWEQELEGTPFARLFTRNAVSVELAADGDGTDVAFEVDQKLRGWARLAPFLVRKAMRTQLDEALAGLDEVVAR